MPPMFVKTQKIKQLFRRLDLSKMADIHSELFILDRLVNILFLFSVTGEIFYMSSSQHTLIHVLLKQRLMEICIRL